MRNQHPQCPGYLPTEKNFQTRSESRHRGQDGAGGSGQRGQGASTEPRISPSANPGQEGGAGGRGTPPHRPSRLSCASGLIPPPLSCS